MSRVLGIGIATLDIINSVEGYPCEDQEVRAVAQRVARGGNGTNTLVVLSQLGHTCSWGGVLADESDADRILEDLRRYRIDWVGGRRVRGGKVPTSYVTLNRRNGSRTIVHYRDLPEFSCEDFLTIDLGLFDWIHFEGRNVAATRLMLEQVRSLHPSIPCSLEIEKPRAGIESLFKLTRLLLFSKGYAVQRGYHAASSFLEAMGGVAPDAELVCAWSEAGAWALDRSGKLVSSSAFSPTQKIDTLGAGDVFNAAVIHAKLNKKGLHSALTEACRLAGKKCGQIGFEGLAGG